MEKADATCICNIMLQCKGAFPDLTGRDRDRLVALLQLRNQLSHMRPTELSTDAKRQHISMCTNLLKDGPWANGPCAGVTTEALKRVQAASRKQRRYTVAHLVGIMLLGMTLVMLVTALWRARTSRLLPQLEALEPHYVPQEELLRNVTAVLFGTTARHRVAALSGLGGVGKSTTALALAWRLARSGACPGQHGVLWGAASVHSGGIAGALADVVRRQLGISDSDSDSSSSSDDAVVRRQLQEWAARRHEPWLLVLDNVEPGVTEHRLQALLGEHGVALITTRAGPKALYRDMGLPRDAVLRVGCLPPEEAYHLMVSRYHASVGTKPLPATEQAAIAELAGPNGLNGLQLALVQASSMVANTAGESFASYAAKFRRLSVDSGAARLPGDDGGRHAVARTITAALRASGLHEVPGLLDEVLQSCDSLDDVQWQRAEDVTWGQAGLPSTVQQHKWRAFQRHCEEQSAALHHKHTVATVWRTQLLALPSYCVELLHAASGLAPQHIPQLLFARAVARLVELTEGHTEEDACAGSADDDCSDEEAEEESNDDDDAWLKQVAEESHLVKAARAKLEGHDAAAAAAAVVDEALQWLEDYSLVQRGEWWTLDRIHPRLATGAVAEALRSSDRTARRPWFSMHRLVQGAVRGTAITGSVALMQATQLVLAALRKDMEGASSRLQFVMCHAREQEAKQPEDMELAAWLVAHDHAAQAARTVLGDPSMRTLDASQATALRKFVGTVEDLSLLVNVLDLSGHDEAWTLSLNLAVVALRRMHGWRDSSEVVEAMNNLAGQYYAQGRYREAEKLYVKALDMAQRLDAGNDHSRSMARSLNNLANLYYAQQRYVEAQPLFERALETLGWPSAGGDDDSGGDDSDVAATLNNLAELHSAMGRFEQAEPLFLKTLAMRRRLARDGDSTAVARTLNGLGLMLNAAQRPEEASQVCVRALDMRQRLHGEADSNNVARALNNLALVHDSRRNFTEAEPLLVQALEMRRRIAHNGDSREVAASLTNLAGMYYAQRRYSEAGPLYEEALAMYTRLAVEGVSRDVVMAMNNLALLHLAQGKYAQAEQLLTEAADLEEEEEAADEDGDEGRGRQRGHGALDKTPNPVEFYQAHSLFAEAEPLYVKSIADRLERSGIEGNADVANALRRLAADYDERQQSSDAEVAATMEGGEQVPPWHWASSAGEEEDDEEFDDYLDFEL